MYKELKSLFKIATISLVCLLYASLVFAGEAYRSFTSTDGATIEATIIACDYPDNISIRRRDGSEFKKVPLDRFSDADRRYVREWVDAQKKLIDDADLTSASRLSVSVLKGVDEDMNNYGDIDDRVIKFKPGVVVESDEKDLTFRRVKGVLVMVGRGVLQKDSYVILDRQHFTLDILPGEKTRWTGNGFTSRYDPDYGGFEYAGYVLVLKNKAGHNVIVKASKSAWGENVKGVLQAKKFTGYDRKFDSNHKLYTTFGLPSSN
ncbi:MAG: hypothetical protein ACN4GF_10785 [Lentimonas sp.]